jgi:hypothetical protein
MDRYQWKTLTAFPWRKIILSDGRRAKWFEFVMGRETPRGDWTYRAMNDVELAEEQKDTAW